MAADVILSEFLFRDRHPVHEADRAADFHVCLQEWAIGFDGKPVALPQVGPMTPDAAAKLGFALPDILGKALKAAVRDRDAANAAADVAAAKRNDALAAAGRAADAAEAVAKDAAATVEKAQHVADEAVAAAKRAVQERDGAFADSARIIEAANARITELSAAAASLIETGKKVESANADLTAQVEVLTAERDKLAQAVAAHEAKVAQAETDSAGAAADAPA